MMRLLLALSYHCDMFKPTVFVSCGQRTAEEKMLGLQICAVVTELTPFKPFFADTQNNLNGLHDNIMSALAKAVGFIAVMHPRGNVSFQANRSR